MRWAKALPSSTPTDQRSRCPYDALGEHAVFIERDQLPQRRRGQSFHQDVLDGIAFENPVRNKPLRRAFRLDLLARFSKRALGLATSSREHFVMPAERVERLFESYEITRMNRCPDDQ